MDAYTIPTQTTTYACQSVTFPTDQERHIVAFRPINVSKYNHHAIVHICTDNAYFGQHNTPQLCSYTGSSTCPGDSGGECRGASPLGEASAWIHLPAGLSPSLVGVVLHHAYLAFGGPVLSAVFASEAVSVTLGV